METFSISHRLGGGCHLGCACVSQGANSSMFAAYKSIECLHQLLRSRHLFVVLFH